MSSFTPITKTTFNVMQLVTQIAAERHLKPEMIDFDLLAFQTFFKTPKHPEWTPLEGTLEQNFDEKLIRSELLQLHQEYEIRLRPYVRMNAAMQLTLSIAANKSKSKVVAQIRSGSMLPCASDAHEQIKSEIYKRKLRAGLMIGIFENDLDDGIATLIHTSPCETPLAEDVRITIGEAPGPIMPVHDSIIYHYDKNEKKDNQLLNAVDEGELIVEYIKPRRGRNGRSCDGKAVEVPEPKIKHAGYIQCDSTVLRRENDAGITYFAKTAGYVKNERGLISISKELALQSASFKGTGSIETGKEKEIVVTIAHKNSSEDAVGSGVNIEVKELNVEGTVGSNARVRADAISVGEQTHRKSELEAVEHANVKLHRGRLKAKTATIDVLETGSVIAEEVHVKKMLGGEIIAHRVSVDELISNATITALESIKILNIFGTNNHLIIDAKKIEGYQQKIDTLVADIKNRKKNLTEKELEYSNRHSAHLALAPRIKTFQKKVLAATQSGTAPMKADVIRIKQYKQNSELLKAEAERIATAAQELAAQEHFLEKLYDADLHASIEHAGSYDGQSKVTFVDTKSSVPYTVSPSGRARKIILEQSGNQKKIAYEN